MDNKRNKRELKTKNEFYISYRPSRCISEDGVGHQVHPQLLPSIGSCLGELRNLFSRRNSMVSFTAAIDLNAF